MKKLVYTHLLIIVAAIVCSAQAAQAAQMNPGKVKSAWPEEKQKELPVTSDHKAPVKIKLSEVAAAMKKHNLILEVCGRDGTSRLKLKAENPKKEPKRIKGNQVAPHSSPPN